METKKLVKISEKKYRAIHADYKGSIDGKRSVFAGCLTRDGGTALWVEGEHFVVTKY